MNFRILAGKVLIFILLGYTFTAFGQENYEDHVVEFEETSAACVLLDRKFSYEKSAPLPARTLVTEVPWSTLEAVLNSRSDTTYIVHFWATWCGPCVQELPSFEKLNQQYAGEKVKILLVSMDFAKDMEKRVVPFVARMGLKNTIWLLNEPDADAWIGRVDPSWTGALPATLILNSTDTKRVFYEKELAYEILLHELEYFVKESVK